MSKRIEATTEWVYSGIWGVLTRWFRVPKEPPTLPARAGEKIESFKPAPEFLAYLKLKFWVALVLIDSSIMVGWLILTIFLPLFGFILLPIALAIAILPDIVAYVAIHLRYDTTWYVLTERSLRIRRGIWVIREMTFTFENIQNVTVTQGPLQRYYGISDVRVDTAGGGSSSDQGSQGQESHSLHSGIIEGIADAHRIRDLILDRLRKSKSAGLGDDYDSHHRFLPETQVLTHTHINLLREIRDTLAHQNK